MKQTRRWAIAGIVIGCVLVAPYVLLVHTYPLLAAVAFIAFAAIMLTIVNFGYRREEGRWPWKRQP
jgi:hypothetical protein